MVFVLAWLPLALDADLYYPAGSRFITTTLLSSANFLFLSSSRLLSKITKESSRAEPISWCNISQMSRDASQTHLPPETKHRLVFPGLGGSGMNLNALLFLLYKWEWHLYVFTQQGCRLRLIGAWERGVEEINDTRRRHRCNHGLLLLLLFLCNYFCKNINNLRCLLLSESSEAVSLLKNHRAGIIREWLKIDH